MKVNHEIIKIHGIETLYYTAELDCSIRGSIIDIETTELDPDNGVITGLGIINFSKLSCFVPVEDAFDDEIQEWMKNKASRTPSPRAAYYKDFEEMWLDIDFEIELQPIPYQKKDMAVDNHYGYKPPAIQIPHLGELSDNSMMPYAEPEEIMIHLVQDMFLELALLVTGAPLYRRYGGNWHFITDKVKEVGHNE